MIDDWLSCLGSFIFSFKNSLGALLGKGSMLDVGDALLDEVNMLPALRSCQWCGEAHHLATLIQEVKSCHSGFFAQSFFGGYAHMKTQMWVPSPRAIQASLPSLPQFLSGFYILQIEIPPVCGTVKAQSSFLVSPLLHFQDSRGSRS